LAPRWKYLLWGLVVLRLMTPLLPASGFSIFNLTHLAPHGMISGVANAPVFNMVIQADDGPEASLKQAAVAPVIAPLVPSGGSVAASFRTGMQWSVSLIWLMGAAWFFTTVIFAGVRVMRRMRQGRIVADESLLTLLAQCKQTMGIRRPVILMESAHIDSPVLYGEIRPRLVLPENMARDYSLPEIRFVLLHELGHVKWHDIIVNWLTCLLQIIHWFNPLVWMAFRAMRAAREEACDALVLTCAPEHHEGTGNDNVRNEEEQKQKYGDTIIKLLAQLSRPAVTPGFIGILEDSNQIKRRIHMIAQFTRDTLGKTLGSLALIAILIVIGCTNAFTHDEKPAFVSNQTEVDSLLKTFAGLKYNQCKMLSKKMNKEIPGKFVEFFAAATGGDWDKTKTMYTDFRKWIGQYEGSKTNEFTVDCHTAMWSPVMETFGAAGQFTAWDPSVINYYGEEILNSIPADSVLFAGTDPGRFVLTAFLETSKAPSCYLVTQNALADNAYMTYLRLTLGDKVRLPDANAVNHAFQEYVDGVRKGLIQSNANVTIEKSGKVNVQGVEGVMQINGIISKQIFDENKGKHPFYVEESYNILWMYPYLEPHGLIMKLNAEPLQKLSAEAIAKDRKYWDACVAKLLSDQHFLQNPPARQIFSKMRCAIAGIYAYRKNMQEAEYAFKQAVTLFPQSSEASYRLADLYCQQERFADAKRVMETTLDFDPVDSFGLILWDKTGKDKSREYIKQIEAMEKGQKK
jgi:beta-lactamase regulating signal transducer with metallopeptidase domain/tetratricopeptide (TPR) repeat protein